MKQHSLQNLATRKVKLRKRRFIWNSRFTTTISHNDFPSLGDTYEKIIVQLMKMIDEPDKSLIKDSRSRL
jgi:hypothetical protein